MTDPLISLGWSANWDSRLAGSPGEPARVIRHDTKSLTVQTRGPVERIPVEKATASLVVGDWITIEHGRLAGIAERTSLLSRPNVRGTGDQLLAANVDVVFAVCGLDRPIPPGRVDRLATLAWDAGCAPILVLAKTDLIDDLPAAVSEISQSHPTLAIIPVSTQTGDGIAEMRAATAGKTAVLIGESGAGKSSIVNAMLGLEAAETGEVRTGDMKGRHTTTSRQIHVVPTGGCIIDSPGIRQIGIVGNPGAVDTLFEDIVDLASECKFSDCSHTSEPGCAILAAVADGSIDQERYDRWRELSDEAEAMVVRAEERSRRSQRKTGRRGNNRGR